MGYPRQRRSLPICPAFPGSLETVAARQRGSEAPGQAGYALHGVLDQFLPRIHGKGNILLRKILAPSMAVRYRVDSLGLAKSAHSAPSARPLNRPVHTGA